MFVMIFLSTFLVFIFLASISVCTSLNCGPYTQSTSTFFLCDGDTISSPGDVQFQLGFFTPKGNLNKSRYLGIWYRSDPEIIVWVANRDNPLPENSFGSFGVLNNGDKNLKLMDASGKEYFSTNISISISMTTAKLKEGGNLVLVYKEAEDVVLWQSFDHPTDTFLPGMKMTQNLILHSWRSSVDPSKGNYKFEQDENGGYLVMILDRTVKYWTSRQSKIFTTGGKMADLTNFLLNDNPTHQLYNSNTVVQQYPNFSKMRLVMNCTGEIQRWEQDVKNGWEKLWGQPESWCDVHNICGKFSICTPNVCNCLPGFSPEFEDNWNSGHYSNGCRRKSDWCEKKENQMFLTLKVIDVEEEQGFMNTEAIDEETCRRACVDSHCECHAYHYSYDTRKKNVCFLWTSDLFDIKVAYDPNKYNSSNIDVGYGINISVKVVSIAVEAGNSEPASAHACL